jgi:transcriptional regulator NrdR family protein
VRCPKCEHAKTYVVKTILPMDKVVESVKQRRRICNYCKDAFMTYEVNEADFNRLCQLIESEGPTRRPLLTPTKKDGNPPIRRPLRSQ